MNAKYLLLNLLFLAPLLAALIRRWRGTDMRMLITILGALCVLTAIFDNLMIAAGIMVYNPATITGIKIGLAPIEDFAYTLAAVLLVAIFWKRDK